MRNVDTNVVLDSLYLDTTSRLSHSPELSRFLKRAGCTVYSPSPRRRQDPDCIPRGKMEETSWSLLARSPKLKKLGTGTGWLIRGSDTFPTGFRPVSDQFQTSVRPVSPPPCTVHATVPLLPHTQCMPQCRMSDAQKCHV